MRSLRLPLRIARREVRRRPGRSLLVALLVALPVAGMAMAVTLIRTDADKPASSWEQENGRADAVVYGRGHDVAPSLPDGSRQLTVQAVYGDIKSATRRSGGVKLADMPLNDPIVAGIHVLVEGRAPSAPDEVAVSAELADEMEVGVGDELALERPGLTRTVVGEIEPVGCLSCGTILFAPGMLPEEARLAFDGSAVVLIDLPDDLTLDELGALQRDSGGNLDVRELRLLSSAGYDGRADGVRWSLVLGAVVLTVVGIVISAAFAVGARRQLVTLGQLSASGASPATVRTALVLQGTVTGLLGTLAGLALAAVLLVTGQSLVERVLDRRIDGYSSRLGDLAAVVVIGVGAATLAALIPARTAARVPTLAALAGRRPLAPVSRRLVTWGVAAVLGGLALLFLAVLGSQSGSSGDTWAFVAIVGGVAELLGACAIAPVVVARLEPLANRLRGSLRLGARSLARNRARTGGVVSAVAAAGALAVAAGGLLLGAEARHGPDSEVPDDVVVVTAGRFDQQTGIEHLEALPVEARQLVLDALPGAQPVTVDAALDPAAANGQASWGARMRSYGADPLGESTQNLPYWPYALIASDAVLDAARVDDGAREQLDETGALILVPPGFGDQLHGEVTAVLPDGRELPAVAVRHEYRLGYTSGVLLTRATAEELGLEVQPAATLFRAPDPLTAAQRDEVQDASYELQNLGNDAESPTYVNVDWESPASGPSPFQVELILSGVALVFSLFVVGVSLALAAAEGKDERDILTIAGAPPGMLARSAGARGWLLAVIGAGMAVPVGFLPVVVFATAQRRDQSGGVFDEAFPLVFPTRTVLLLVVVVPLAVALASWFTSATAQRLRPVRVSTAVFE
jgi:putative ABC transport system permease protein